MYLVWFLRVVFIHVLYFEYCKSMDVTDSSSILLYCDELLYKVNKRTWKWNDHEWFNNTFGFCACVSERERERDQNYSKGKQI